MEKVKVMSKATMQGCALYKVIYEPQQDAVVLEIGDTSLRLNVCNFMIVNEMMRKAAARLVMQSDISSHVDC